MVHKGLAVIGERDSYNQFQPCVSKDVGDEQSADVPRSILDCPWRCRASFSLTRGASHW